jgi:hypothetical protein
MSRLGRFSRRAATHWLCWMAWISRGGQPLRCVSCMCSVSAQFLPLTLTPCMHEIMLGPCAALPSPPLPAATTLVAAALQTSPHQQAPTHPAGRIRRGAGRRHQAECQDRETRAIRRQRRRHLVRPPAAMQDNAPGLACLAERPSTMAKRVGGGGARLVAWWRPHAGSCYEA